MDSASLEQLLASLTPEPHADMVAGATAGSAPAHDGPLALVNTIPRSQDLTHQAPSSHQPGQHPDQHWNGRRETLGSWLTEFETVLSAESPELHEFAVEYVLSDRARTVIFFSGQAAQLDGAMPRPTSSPGRGRHRRTRHPTRSPTTSSPPRTKGSTMSAVSAIRPSIRPHLSFLCMQHTRSTPASTSATLRSSTSGTCASATRS